VKDQTINILSSCGPKGNIKVIMLYLNNKKESFFIDEIKI